MCYKHLPTKNWIKVQTEVNQKAENDKYHNRSRRFVNISRRYNFNSVSELVFRR